MTDLKINIVIVTYNAERWLDDSIGRLRDIKTPHQTIVIDNNSSDNTCELIAHGFPEVNLIRLDDNIGFGRANNQGLKKAYEGGADYILLLNQDAWLEPDTLELLIGASERFSGYGIISPMHLDGSGSTLDYNFSNYMRSNKQLISDLYLKDKGELEDIYHVDFVNAAIWLLPRQTLEQVGGFNPLFFMYGEDREFVNRCHYRKLEIGIVPRARAYHGRQQVDSIAKKKLMPRITQLVDLVDPNTQSKVGWLARSLFSEAVAASLLLDFARARSYISDAYFFLRNRRLIARSKEDNKISLGLYL